MVMLVLVIASIGGHVRQSVAERRAVPAGVPEDQGDEDRSA